MSATSDAARTVSDGASASKEAWLALRRSGIGGSDIPAIMGLASSRSALTVYLDKIGFEEKSAQSEAMFWGTVHERSLAERFRELHPELILARTLDARSEPSPADVRVGPEPWMLATFDGLVYRDDGSGLISDPEAPIAGWEAKTARDAMLAAWRAGVPPAAYVQVQWYMLVSGLPRWYVSALIGGNTYIEHVVERDDETIEAIVEQARYVWNCVQRRTPPDPDASAATGRALAALYPAATVMDEELTGDEVMETLAREYLMKRAELHKLEEDVRGYENALKAMLGEHARARTPGGLTVEWKPESRTTIDTKALREQYPDVAARFSRTTEYRRFSVNTPRER